VRLEGEHVADIGEGGAVADDPGEADLPALVEGAEAEGVLHGLGHGLPRNSPRPVRGGEEAVDHVEIEPRAIRGDDDTPRARLVHPPAPPPRRLPSSPPAPPPPPPRGRWWGAGPARAPPARPGGPRRRCRPPRGCPPL